MSKYRQPPSFPKPQKSHKTFEEGIDEQAYGLMTGTISMTDLEENSTSAVVTAVQKRAKELVQKVQAGEESLVTSKIKRKNSLNKSTSKKLAKLLAHINESQQDFLVALFANHEQHPQLPQLLKNLEKSSQEKLELFFDMCINGYGQMIDVLESFGFKTNNLPSWEVILKALNPDILLKALNMEKPTLLIIPPGDFSSKIDAINTNKKITHQQDIVCHPSPMDALWGKKQAHLQLTIVDGPSSMPLPSYITADLDIGQKMSKYEDEFAKQKLDIMSSQEGAMLMMISLKLEQPIDNIFTQNTITFLSRKDLKKGSFVPALCWYPKDRAFGLDGYCPTFYREHLRCRPSIMVLEFQP